MAKVRKQKFGPGYEFYCPACGSLHATGDHTFNGDVDAPTFAPSIMAAPGQVPRGGVCHSYISSGRIIYAGDCTNGPNGNRPIPFDVELPDLDEVERTLSESGQYTKAAEVQSA